MSAFNFSQYKNIKIGDTDIKKVKYGSNLLWPVPDFILYRNGVYYEVSGIENNEYVTTQNDINVAPLVNITDMMFELGLPVQTKLIFEYAMCGFDGVLLNDGRLTSSNTGTSNIHNNKSTSQITFRYMGGSTSSANSQTTNNSTDTRKVLCNRQTTTDYLLRFTLGPYTSPRYSKSIYLNDLTNVKTMTLANTTYVYDLSETYQNQYMAGYTFKIGDINDTCQKSYGKKFWCNFYYLKIIDYDTSAVVGLYYFKNDNDTLKLYDHVSNSFMTSTSGNNASLTKLDKSIVIPGITPNDYYYVDGTIEINGVTYEKLVNNLDSTKIKKGIQIDTDVTLVNPEVEWLLPDYDLQMTCSTPGASIYWSVSGESPEESTDARVLYTEPVNWSVLYDMDDEYSGASEGFVKVQSYLNGTWSEVVEFDFYA